MNTSTLKSIVIMLCILLFSINAMALVTHGSIKGVAIPLYTPGTTGGDITKPVATTVAVLDYKVVTIGSKSWIYTKFTGTSTPYMASDASGQFRYWGGATFSTMTTNNLNVIRNTTTKEVIGSTTVVPPSPLKISFWQDLSNYVNGETLQIPYDVTAKNSLIPSDNVAPVITASNSSALTETSATLTIAGSDDQSDLFYYITGNGITEVSFLPSITLNGLAPGTVYNLTVTPIDFSGNEGIPANVQFTTVPLVQITSGIAQDIRFVLKSTATTLEYYYEYTDPTKRFNKATLGITPSGGTSFDVTPTISPDSTYCYGTTNDGKINGKIITLNFKYTTINLPAVTTNSTITSGTLTGTTIKHQMGNGPAVAETNSPVLSSVSLIDVKPSAAILDLQGTDDTGTIYYTITGGTSTVDAFRTGKYYFSNMINGQNVYTLNIQGKDLSGNSSTNTITQKVKTMKVRSNIKDSIGLDYATNTISPNKGEVVTIIHQSGTNLTLGYTTKSLLIQTANRNKTFNNSKVVINGTSYPLTIDANNTTATATFSNLIGTTPITEGMSITVKWTHNWGLTGGGAFNTGTFNYTAGDAGQVDVEAPTAPVLTVTGSMITWPACSDLLSGVKWYTVTETGQTPVKIFDFNEESFNYTIVNPTDEIVVTATDFVGNVSNQAKVVGGVTIVKTPTLEALTIYPNPASNRISISGYVNEVALYSIQGQLVHTEFNKSTMDVSTFEKGLYIVRITDKNGNKQSKVLEIR